MSSKGWDQSKVFFPFLRTAHVLKLIRKLIQEKKCNKCKVCDIFFAQFASLRIHQRVHSKIWATRVRFVTFLISVKFLFSVNTLMASKTWVFSKGFVIFLKFVSFLPNVNTLMTFKMWPTGKGFVTFHTFVRFVPSMNSDSFLVISNWWKICHIPYICMFLSNMYSLMYFEIWMLGKGFFTNDALVGFNSTMNSLMFIEVRGSTETFPTEVCVFPMVVAKDNMPHWNSHHIPPACVHSL